MPTIHFALTTLCESEEPSRVVPAIQGEIFEFDEVSNDEVKVGTIQIYLVLRSRAMNEGISLFEAMDSIDDSVHEFYAALFDDETEDWNASIEGMYKGQIPEGDVLLIDRIELDSNYRSHGIGAAVVRETIALFGSTCGLVACKPFPLQYQGWQGEDKKHLREQAGFEQKRLADFAKVEHFWTDLGFRKVPDSEIFAYCPQLIEQPSLAAPRSKARKPAPRHRNR